MRAASGSRSSTAIPGAPGFGFADRRCILSTEDEPAIERLVGALEIDGIISPGTDWPVGVAARIAERAGLPHPISPETAVLATNKLRQRERLRRGGRAAAALVGRRRRRRVPRGRGPVVVKAPDRQGQKGLTLVAEPAELPAAIETARGAARNGLALVEELVDGPGGDRGRLLGRRRLHGARRHRPARGRAARLRRRARARLAQPCRAPGAAEAAAAAVAALGIENGPVLHAASRRARRAEGDRGRRPARRRPRRRARRGRDGRRPERRSRSTPRSATARRADLATTSSSAAR